MSMTHDDFDTEISCEEFYDDSFDSLTIHDFIPDEMNEMEVSEEDWDDDDIDVADVARFFGYEPDELFDENGGLTAQAFAMLGKMDSEGAFAS